MALFYHTISELAVIKFGIKAVLLEQGFVVALFDDIAVFHDEDKVGVTDGGEAVGDNETGAAFSQLFESGLDFLFGASIDV